MKKFKIVATIILAMFLLTACGVKCDICDKLGADHQVQAVTEWNLCDDCYYDVMSDYDYDYNNYGSSSLGYGTCQDCGKSIDDDRLYCDKCLGYGTCQDCGKSIDDDRLYCDKCLGYGTCQDCGKSISDDRLYCDSCLYN